VRRRHLLLAAIFVLLSFPAAASGGRGLFVGFDDDTLKWTSQPNGVLGVNRDLGVGVIRITIPWRRGQVRAPRVSQTYLSRAARAIELGHRIVIAVYGPPEQAPLDSTGRDQYCGYVRHVLAVIPQISGVVVWNEANSPDYWPARAGAPAYEALLARCWDVLHGLRHPVNVIDSTASHYDPAGFIRALGEAYRRSGRTRPIVDTFGHNPYPETASEEPWARHAGSATIGEGDYGTLMDALSDAFLFTAQPVPSDRRPTLWYLEDGFQTAVPRPLRSFYHGRENDVFVVPALGGVRSQAAQLRDAVELAYCQPAVGAFFNFELIDERRLTGWQSGLIYANGVRKPSYDAFKRVVADVAGGRIDCATVPGAAPSAASARIISSAAP
jgi:hypothetical protein